MKEEIKLFSKSFGIYWIKTMKPYYVTCKKNIANKNYSVRKTKQNKSLLVSNCAVCDKKNQGLLKIQKWVNYWGN